MPAKIKNNFVTPWENPFAGVSTEESFFCMGGGVEGHADKTHKMGEVTESGRSRYQARPAHKLFKNRRIVKCSKKRQNHKQNLKRG